MQEQIDHSVTEKSSMIFEYMLIIYINHMLGLEKSVMIIKRRSRES